MRKIKVLMVLGSTGIGGTQAFLLNLLHYIDHEKFQIDVAVNHEDHTNQGCGEDLREYGCQLFLWPYFKIYNYCKFVEFWKSFLSIHHYDIVHGHSTNSASIYLKIAKQMGCVTIAHSHNEGYKGNWLQRIPKRLFAKGAKKVADYWFACSDKAALRLFCSNYQSNRNFYAIPDAIILDKYLYDEKAAKKIREEMGVKENELLCGHVGTFSLQKNHRFLLSIFREILKIRPDAKLVCCGGGYLMPKIKEKVRSMGLADRVVFAGVVTNANEYMMAMDVMIFPSLFEGFGMAVLEAEATGLPVVMSDVIPQEVDLTDCVHRMSLKYSASEWADKICHIEAGKRENYFTAISKTKYDMRQTSKTIEEIYLKCVNTNFSKP